MYEFRKFKNRGERDFVVPVISCPGKYNWLSIYQFFYFNMPSYHSKAVTITY